MHTVKVENLNKSYQVQDKRFLILDRLCLEVEEKQIVSVEGASGVGKSTLLNILGAMDDFDQGSVSVCGIELYGKSERETEIFRASKISFIFQPHLLLPDFTALENVMIPLLISKIPQPMAESKSKSMLDRVGL